MAGDDSTMTLDSVKRRSGQFDPASIQWLAYAGCGVREVQALEPCVGLRVLDLSRNKIAHGGCLPFVPMLRDLDLSDNLFSNLAGLEELPAIRILKLQGNHIRDLSALEVLKTLPTLKRLYLRDVDGSRANPVCNHPAYQSTVFKLLPHLETLDGEHSLLIKCAQEVYKAEAEAKASDEAVELPPAKPWLDGFSWEATGVRTADHTTATRLYAGVQEMISDSHDLVKQADALLKRYDCSVPPASTES